MIIAQKYKAGTIEADICIVGVDRLQLASRLVFLAAF
jgi:hypothetical protein